MPVGVAQSASQTNYPNIIAAVLRIAQANALTGTTLSFPANATKTGEIPTPKELSVGMPFLAVRKARFPGYSAFGGVPAREEVHSRLIDGSGRELSWDFDVVVLLPYSSTSAATEHYTLCAQIMANLEQAFQLNYGLVDANGNITCEECKVFLPNEPMPYVPIGGTFYLAAHVIVRAKELQPVVY